MTEYKKRLARQKQRAWQKRQQQAKKAAAGKKGSSSGKQLGELPKNESEKRRQEKVDKQNCQM
jgi:hypothetical protein